MTKPLMLVITLLALLIQTRAPRAETLVPGGGPAKSDCYGEWLAPAPNRGVNGIDCQDGDPACDLDGTINGACAIATAVCLHQTNVPRCTPGSVQHVSVRAKPRRIQDLPVALPPLPPAPVTAATCGSDAIVRLPLRSTRTGQQRPSKRITLHLTTTVRTKPHTDDDTLKLRCVPNAGAGSCGANPAGGPAELRLITGGAGTDLDLGWAGSAHNLAIIANASLRVCLAGCDATANSHCTERADETGAVNGASFGAPLPLLAGGVPFCVVNRFGAPAVAGVSADVASGHVTGTINLVSQVFRTSATRVCPRCSAPTPGDLGTCDSGIRQGRGCVTAGVVGVPGAEGNPDYAVSADCPPVGVPVGSVPFTIPATTGVATLPGPRPCGAARDDDCASGCGGACTGAACVSTTNGECIDARGGVSQLCCTTDSQHACFATAPGAPIVRIGSATAPVPPFGDPTYPKIGGLAFAGAFCAAASGSALVDTLIGLPGPGALLLPMAAAWLP